MSGGFPRHDRATLVRTRAARTRRLAIGAGVALGLGAGGCHLGLGPTPETFEPAQRPAGVHATLRLADQTVEGELLELRDSTLLLLTAPSPRIAAVPLSSIRVGNFAQARESIVRGRFSSESERNVIRQLSRFPAGIPESVLRILLETHGQTTEEDVP